jgi:diacylglycerol kinase family enzyme
MYLYIYDSCLKDKKFENLLTKIEGRIIDLDIKGEILRMNLLKNISQFLKDGIKKGAHTVIVIGDDKTFSTVLESAMSENIVMGYIPIDKKSKFAQIFGIPYGDLACAIIGGRIIETIDIGKINNKFFLGSVIIENSPNTELKIENFKVRVGRGNKIIIKNIDFEEEDPGISNPTDGLFEIFVEKTGGFMSKNSKHTLIKTDELLVTSKDSSTPLIFDGIQTINTPAQISVAKEKLKIIVGTNRKF